MSAFNTFTGKTVDDAITEACRFFAIERDKLEVEIVSGGSTGIFGLVGKKKAQIKARRRLDPAVEALIQEEELKAQAAAKSAAQASAQAVTQPSGRNIDQAQGRNAAPAASRPPQETSREADRNGRGAQTSQPGQAGRNGQDGQEGQSSQADRNGQSGQTARNGQDGQDGQPGRDARNGQDRQGGQTGQARPPKPREARPARPQKPREPREPRDHRPERPKRPEPSQAKADPRPQFRDDARPRPESPEFLDDDLPAGQDQSPATPELLALAAEVMGRLLTPILEQAPKMEIEGTASRVNVLIEDEEHSGLLIGREGQTLAALQYLANRMVARRWESPVRVQINTGEYREKQDDNLRKMALYLADKARNLGRPQSTKPLSSYHRRVIHMALQGDETVQTRSKGDGPMKRVIIVPRRPKAEAQPQ